MYSSFCGDFTTNVNAGDTTLRLDGFGYGSRKSASFGNDQTDSDGCWGASQNVLDDGCKLVLGLGPTPTAYSENCSSSADNKAKGIASILRGLPSHADSLLKLRLSGEADAVSTILDFSGSTHGTFDVPHQTDQESSGVERNVFPVVDEGSTSAKKSGGYMTTLILAPRMENPEIPLCSEPSGVSNYSMNAGSEFGNAAVSSEQRGNYSRKCKFLGCVKGARGATGLCIGHGGGQRCQKPGCNKGAESRTAYCKAHGGGKRCQHLGCTKSAEGKTDHCIAHGGGRRCGHPNGCNKAARGKSGLCIKHGGGKRCKIDGCTRSAEGQIGLCISHGGGRRCQFQDCNKGAQGSTIFCKAHGGGKRCIFAGCSKGAEGSTPLCKGHGGGKRCMYDGGGICPKSVHGGTNYCVAHGGGKRCAVPGCTKSARGRTDCCVKHGGGKRCKIDGCGKSAQGSTEFCKAHGGGKRCQWVEGKCEKFARGKSGLCAAHTSLVQGHDPKKEGMIGPGLFHGLVPAAPSAATRSSFNNTVSSSSVSVISDSNNSLERSTKRQRLIPPQVLVPLSMKASAFCSGSSGPEKQAKGGIKGGAAAMVVPEGRVHGGGLLSLLRGNIISSTIDGI